jgi:hypothetical protein
MSPLRVAILDSYPCQASSATNGRALTGRPKSHRDSRLVRACQAGGPDGPYVRFAESVSGEARQCMRQKKRGDRRAGAAPHSPLSSLPSSNGRGEIRTHDTGFTGMPVFETGAFNHSATRPGSLATTAAGHLSTRQPRRNVNRPRATYQRAGSIQLARASAPASPSAAPRKTPPTMPHWHRHTRPPSLRADD